MTIALISAYIEARDALNTTKTNYVEQRNVLRVSFLSTERGVDFENNLREKISSLPYLVQARAISLYSEWMLRLEVGILTESDKELDTETFLNRFVEFHSSYSDLIEGSLFETANKTKAVLRGLFFTAHQKRSTDQNGALWTHQLIQDWSVTDPELQKRMMRNDWA